MRTIPLCVGPLLLVALPAVVFTGPAGAAVPDQTHTTFKAVETEGTGCPAGSTNTSISDDGLVFTTTFSAFEAKVAPDELPGNRECKLTVKVHTPPGRSVTLQSFSASGYAYLEAGVRGLYRASYTVGGQNVIPKVAPRTPFVGPHDDDFVIRDEMPEGAWTPCGTDHELVITTSLFVENAEGNGSGYLNVAAFDGSSQAQSRVQERTCTPGTPGPTTTTTTAPGPGAGTRAVAVKVQPHFTG